MKLLTKFNIVLIIFFGAGGLLIAKLAKDFLWTTRATRWCSRPN